MKGVLYQKLNNPCRWTGYNQDWNIVKSNIHDCDGFDVMYNLLSDILSKINIIPQKSSVI